MKTPDTLIELEPLCAAFNAVASEMEAATADLEKDLAEVRDFHSAGFKALALRVAEAEAAVRAWVASHPESFTSPRTHCLGGVEVGLQAGVGSVEFDDEATLIARLKKQFSGEPETLAILVDRKESVSKTALRALPADVFTRIGCRIEGAGDAVVVRRSAGEIEKILKAAISSLVKALVEQGTQKPKKGKAKA